MDWPTWPRPEPPFPRVMEPHSKAMHTCALSTLGLVMRKGVQRMEVTSAIKQVALMADSLLGQGYVAQGEQLLRKNLRTGERKLGKRHPELLKPLMHLASHLCMQERTNEAVNLYLRAIAICETHSTTTGHCKLLISNQLAEALTAAHEVNEAAPRCRQHTPPPIGPYETIITGLEPMHASTTAPTHHHRSTVLDSSYSSAHAIDNSNHPLEPDKPTLSPSKCHQAMSRSFTAVSMHAEGLYDDYAHTVTDQSRQQQHREATPSGDPPPPAPCDTPEALHPSTHVVAHVPRIPTNCGSGASLGATIQRDCLARSGRFRRVTPHIPRDVALAGNEEVHEEEEGIADDQGTRRAAHGVYHPVVVTDKLVSPMPYWLKKRTDMAGVHDSVSSPVIRAAAAVGGSREEGVSHGAGKWDEGEEEEEEEAGGVIGGGGAEMWYRKSMYGAARRAILSQSASPELREAAFGVLKAQVAHDKAVEQFERLLKVESSP